MTNFTRMHNDYLDPDRHIPNWCDDFDEDTESPDPIIDFIPCDVDNLGDIPDCPDEEYNLPFEWQNDLLNDYF